MSLEFEIIMRGGGIARIGDDGPADALGKRLAAARRSDDSRFLTSITVTAEDVKDAIDRGVPVEELQKVGEQVITGDWDAKEVLHFIPVFDEEEQPDPKKQQKVDMSTMGGKNKRH